MDVPSTPTRGSLSSPFFTETRPRTFPLTLAPNVSSTPGPTSLSGRRTRTSKESPDRHRRVPQTTVAGGGRQSGPSTDVHSPVLEGPWKRREGPGTLGVDPTFLSEPGSWGKEPPSRGGVSVSISGGAFATSSFGPERTCTWSTISTGEGDVKTGLGGTGRSIYDSTPLRLFPVSRGGHYRRYDPGVVLGG